MINQYPFWKYLLIAFLIVIGTIYALPNLYGDDPALQISANRMAEINTATRDKVIKTLDKEQLAYKSLELSPDSLLVRFADTDTQLKAYEPVL